MNQELKSKGWVSEKNGPQFGGLFLILLGGIFYLSQADIRPFGKSPWLLFIFVPAFFVVCAAWQQFQANGYTLSRQVVGTAVLGLFPFIIGGAFAFGISSSIVLPVMFILLGVGVLINQR